jgi:pimeloyl-ACP methyl ester carboxylesterase
VWELAGFQKGEDGQDSAVIVTLARCREASISRTSSVSMTDPPSLTRSTASRRSAVRANPLRSLSGDAAYIASVLKTIKGPIVLVGHSYGGAVITDAATGNPNVKALVYIDAFVPAQGETVLSLAAKYPGSELPRSITEAPYTQGGGQSGVDVYIKTADFRSAFAGDVSPAKAAVMAIAQRPVTLAALSEKSRAPAWKSIPSWYLVGRQDEAIPPAAQLFMAKRARSHTVEINASHASLVSHPAAVTKLILDAAHDVER